MTLACVQIGMISGCLCWRKNPSTGTLKAIYHACFSKVCDIVNRHAAGMMQHLHLQIDRRCDLLPKGSIVK